MKYRVYVFLAVCLGILGGCTRSNERLKAVLKYSGNNRGELEKVLAHYSENQSDSLKLQAAIFLIENMPGHYTYSGEMLDSYYANLDTVKGLAYHEKKLLQMIPFTSPLYRPHLQVQEDVKSIKADFLIHQIDLAFSQWQTLPWLEGVDFDCFKEYLLPYRINHEALDYWRDSNTYFNTYLKDYIDYYQDARYSISRMQEKFVGYIKNPTNKIPDPNLRHFQLDCIPVSKLTLLVDRILGIPAAIDYIPHFGNRNGRHYWTVGIDPQINIMQVFQAELYRAPKIYRRTFSHNPIAIPDEDEYIPPFFYDPFNRDVTELYMPTTDLTICFSEKVKSRNVYLAIFNDLTWKPIAYSEPIRGEVTFSKIGRDIAYLPVYYDEKKEMHPLSHPVLLFGNGQARTLTLRKDSTQTMVLTRKYPLHSSRDYWIRDIVNSFFEASDFADFRNAKTMCRIIQKPSIDYQYLYPDSTQKKRYWRFISNKIFGNSLAELHFFDSHNREIKGKMSEVDSVSIAALTDNDLLTAGAIGKRLCIDFGEPVSISQIYYMPINDANGIYPNNDYELFYYDYPQGWVSMGVKTTTANSIIYENVPVGGLYWLRNLTCGREERIFTMENGEVRFW